MMPNRPSAPRSRSAISRRLASLLLLPLLLAGAPAHSQSLIPEQKPTLTTLTEAGMLERAGKFAEALSKVEKAIEEEPDQARPLFLKGIILLDMDRLDEAAAVFQSVRETFPEMPESYNNLGVIHMRQGRFELARRDLELAVIAHPNYATAHDNLGAVYARMAAEEYSQSLRLDSSSADTRRKLDLIRELLKDPKATPAPAPKPMASGPENVTPLTSPVPGNAPTAQPIVSPAPVITGEGFTGKSVKDLTPSNQTR